MEKVRPTDTLGRDDERARGVEWAAKKPAQNKALEKIAALLNQAIEGDVKQAYVGIASQVRGSAEKLEPKSARRAVGRKKVTRKKPVATKKKPPARRGRVKPTEKAVEPTETTTP